MLPGLQLSNHPRLPPATPKGTAATARHVKDYSDIEVLHHPLAEQSKNKKAATYRYCCYVGLRVLPHSPAVTNYFPGENAKRVLQGKRSSQ